MVIRKLLFERERERERERESSLKFFSKVLISLGLILFISLSILPPAFASEGNISETNKYSWSENAGWNNWRPTSAGITVTSSELSGYLWCENIGWVKLKGTALNATAYGVTKDGSGNLSGYGWSENAGWINFAPTGAAASPANINNTTHDFSGYVWAENVGWVKLAGTALNATTYKVSLNALDHFTFTAASPQTSGTAFTGTNTLTAQDASGNTVTLFDASANNVTVTSPEGGTISGLGSGANNVLNQAGNFVNGVANLTTLGMIFSGTAGNHTFTATSADSKTGTSGAVTINAGAAAKLGIQTQPGGGSANIAWAQQPVVLIQDASGNTVTTDNATVVTAAIGTNPGAGTLSGTLTATAVNGVATFAGLKTVSYTHLTLPTNREV